MTYEIQDLNKLDNSASLLAKYNQKIENTVNSLNEIITALKNNWQNEQGADLYSILEELNNSIAVLKTSIQPTIANYIKTINTIVTNSIADQSKSIN